MTFQSGDANSNCARGESTGASIKIPHVGWNELDLRRRDSIVEGVSPGAQVYFTHSFAAPITAEVFGAAPVSTLRLPLREAQSVTQQPASP